MFSLFSSENGVARSLTRQTLGQKTEDNVGLLEIKDYKDWWSKVGKKTRNMVRRAEKSDVKVSVVEPSEKLTEGM